MARFLEEWQGLVSVLESRLKSVRWLAGEHFTIADIANHTWLSYGEAAGVDLSSAPALMAWLRASSCRAAVKKAYQRLAHPDAYFSSGESLLAD